MNDLRDFLSTHPDFKDDFEKALKGGGGRNKSMYIS